ncbi:MAG: ankyrin repeat domain-containing protein [Rickettsiaceae bacterium]|nr:ankyrin repeat domain-containing protein [Rickettsiaceae bacterium]
MSKSASKNPLLRQLFKYIYQADLTKITECLNKPNISEFINSYYIEGFDQYLQQKFKKAQHQNDVELCRKILLQQKNVTGVTPLSYACVLDKIEVIKIFLSCEAIDINSCNWDNTRAFSIAIRNNNITTIELLLEHNVSTDYIDDYKHTPLTQAIYLLMSNKIYFKIAKLLLDYVDINFCNGDGLSPLCLALNYKNTTGYYCMANPYKYYKKIIKLLEKKGS